MADIDDLQVAVTARSAVLDAEGRMLILKRSASDPLHPGTWDLPGGRADPGEDCQTTAVRETQEEAGITLADPALIFATSDMRGDVSKTWLFFAETIAADQAVVLGDEHDEYRWIDPATLDEYTDYDILMRLYTYLMRNIFPAEPIEGSPKANR